jgi:hypothetical protein
MNLHIDKYKQPDGGYKMPNDSYCCDAEEVLHIAILGFCGCGRPKDSLAYMRDVLKHIDELHEIHEISRVYEERKPAYDAWDEKGKSLFATEGAKYFMFYFLDNIGFTEHGGSVPGWLTEEGREFLEDVTAYLLDEESSKNQ